MRIADAKQQIRIETWVRNIQDRQSSGQTIKSWCAANGYRESQYYYWLKVVRRKALEHIDTEKQQCALVRVDPQELRSSLDTVAPIPLGNMILQYGSATVTIPAGISAETVAQLLKALNAHD